MKLNLPNPLRVAIIGKDARTHATAVACSLSVHPHELHAWSEHQNPGLIATCGENHFRHVASLTDVKLLATDAKRCGIHLAIIGPEEPLAAGIVDEFAKVGILSFGPSKELALIETSKAWTRKLVEKHRIAGNPRFKIFESTEDVVTFIKELGEFVIKPDGLTSGKGVRVSGEHIHSPKEAVEYCQDALKQHGRVVVEEKLEGEEFSLQTITDGSSFIHCPLVQDHKRAYDGDTGPNTGGMGSYSCADHSMPFLEASHLREARAINEAVVRAIRVETGRPYCGVLYGGFIATRTGVGLIEYNCRFGDPEAMNILPLLHGDFISLCYAAASGALNEVDISFKQRATVCKYVVPDGYPESPKRHGRILVPSEYFKNTENLHTYFAAVNQDRKSGDIMLTGSRAMAFVGIGQTVEDAERVAEAAASSVRGSVRHRQDIGTARLIQRRIDHMECVSKIDGHHCVGVA